MTLFRNKAFVHKTRSRWVHPWSEWSQAVNCYRRGKLDMDTHRRERQRVEDAGQSQESLESYGCINKALGLESFSVVSDEAQPCRHPCVGIFWLSQLQVVCGTTHWKQGGDRQASGCGVYRRDIPVVGSWEKCFELMIPRRGLRFLTQIITAIPGKRNTVDQKWVVDRLLGMEGGWPERRADL